MTRCVHLDKNGKCTYCSEVFNRSVGDFVWEYSLGNDILGHWYYLKAWKETNGFLGFVPQNHPIQQIPL